MSEQPIQIMLVNINQQSDLTHTLLQTSTADIILIQEPWVGTVQTAWSDTDPMGTAIFGATNNNLWVCYLPSFTDPDLVYIAIFVKHDLACTFSFFFFLGSILCAPWGTEPYIAIWVQER